MKSALAMFLFLIASPVMACDCKPLPAVPEAFKRSAAVVDATVVSVRDRDVGMRKLKVWFQTRFGSAPVAASDDGSAVTLKVHEMWKGEPRSEIIMYTQPDEAACGLPMRPGQRYLIYASRDANQEYEISLCSRTRPRSQGLEDAATLSSLTKSKKF
jgi:hypothetical protein